MSTELIKAVAVTAELCGRTFSPEAAKVFVDDLKRYPTQAILAALTRCRREVRGALTIADVISRIDDGRPGVEEAWALLPRGEEATVVLSDEMFQAWGIVRTMIGSGEDVAARMAFKETYLKLVAAARDDGRPVHWTVSGGTNKEEREQVIRQAVEKGQLPANQLAVFGYLDEKKRAELKKIPVRADVLVLPDKSAKEAA
jgi:hypothetical protein